MTRRLILGASLLVGVAACSEGCAHERYVADPLPVTEHLTFDDLQARAWPPTPDRWQPLAEAQLVALEQLVTMLIDAAEAGRLEPPKRRQAAILSAFVGLELHDVSVEVDGRDVALWVLSEAAHDRRGRGVYMIRVGLIGAPEPELELLLQAPHCRFDKHTGTIAMKLFLEADAGPPRALFINSAHRYRQADGSRRRLQPAASNPADAAHNPNHPIARVTTRLLEQRELTVIQLHGFGRSAEAGDPEMIVSAGVERPQRASAATLERLRLALPEHASGHFGVDTDRLGARSNVQGRSARTTARCFVHIELSERLREQLRDDRELRRRFAGAVLGGSVEELRGGCR